MKYHILYIIVVISTIVGFGHWAPTFFKWDAPYLYANLPTESELLAELKLSEEILNNKKPLKNIHEILEEAIKPSKKRPQWRQRPPRWSLHRGSPFLLQVQKAITIINTNDCMVKEAKESANYQFVSLKFKCSNKDLDTLVLQPGTTYLEQSSKLAIIFKMDSTSIGLLNALNSFKAPLNLLFNPYSKSEQLVNDLVRIKEKVLITQGALEPQNYSSYSHGKVIRIYYTENEIDGYFKQLMKKTGKSKWVQFRHGSLARNNPKILDRVFLYMKNQGISLIDFTNQYQSQLRTKCVEHNLNCHFPEPVSKNKTSIERLETALFRTRNTGENILILPATIENIKLVQDYYEIINNQGTELVAIDAI